MNNQTSLPQKVYYFIKIKNRWTGIDELLYEQQFKNYDKNTIINAAQQLMECGALKPNDDVANVSLYTKLTATSDYYSLEDFLKNRKKATIKNETERTAKSMSFIELLSWIFGIIGVLISIYEFILKRFF